MLDQVDILEDDILRQYPGVLEKLLLDHTTRKRIFWATDSYKDMGEGYQFNDEISVEHITGANGQIIQPRALKDSKEQTQRTKDKAEVFTPSWVCNAQNNLIDEQWFGRKDVFNVEVEENGVHTWIPTPGKIEFTDTRKGGNRTWQAYVRDRRMEITCGEAPYLVSRYDTVTGELIEDLNMRVGLLDRKMRVINENVTDHDEWIKMAKDALKSTYGYEWQGDSLLLAREALLFTVIDYYKAQFPDIPIDEEDVVAYAYIISWNLWQMDGLRMVVPGSCDNVYAENLFGEMEKQECTACKKGELTGHVGIKCKIRDWKKKRDPKWQPQDEEEKADLEAGGRPWQKITFQSLLTNPSKDSEE